MTASLRQHNISTVFQAHSQSPLTIEVPPPNVVLTFSGPGNSALTTPALAIEPSSWLTTTKPARTHGTAPIKAIPSVTAGLNKPPLMRKNTHAFTARLNPKTRLM